ncbi:MAG: HesA/MoeB/ThiF family protein [Magnetococcales bacterium]|nr:HesA/MoeB/ThiF family protein [Magnetococcales bacterium]
MPGVLLIGAGGLGVAVALALSGTPLRRLGIVDPDIVSLSNLQRQVLYHTSDLDKAKVTCVVHHLAARCPDLEVTPHRMCPTDAGAIIDLARDYDLLVDGSDNFPTRFAANDAAVTLGIPLVHGAATGCKGQVMSIAPGRSACLRCLFGGPPEEGGPTCRTQGVLGSLVGEVGWLMALEAAHWLAGNEGRLLDRLLTIDVISGRRRHVPLHRQKDCTVCGRPGVALRFGRD